MSEETGFITPDPQADQQPVAREGQYDDGQLISINGRVLDTKRGPVSFVEFTTRVFDPEVGSVFVRSQPFGPSHTQSNKGSGSKVNTFFAQLGLDPDQFETQPDEFGRYAYRQDVKGMPVVVDVGLREYASREEKAAAEAGERDPQPDRQQNYIRNIWAKE